MIIRRKPRSSRIPAEIAPIIHLWLLRLLVPLGGHREFVTQRGFNNDALAEAIGLGEWIDPENFDFDPKAVRALLRKDSEDVERRLSGALAPADLRRNVEQLATLVGLSHTDCRILELVVLIQNERLLDDTADTLGQLTSIKLFHVLAVLLDLPEADIRHSLSAHGILARSGLVSIDRSGANPLRGKLDLLSNTFADHIVTAEADPITLLRDTVNLGAPAHLTIRDYGHIERALSVLRPYLRHSSSSGRKGVNIFLHGEPGTGKSQLAKVLAEELGCELFEVASEDSDGDPVNGERRLRAFRAAQSFFAQRRALILFDEVEDVFNDGNSVFGRKSTAQLRKAWVNRTLEENAVPTLWLANSISGLDPAFIRRFDMVFELPVPPKSQRVRIVEAACADLVDAATVARIADAETLAPAVVARAASVVRPIRELLGPAGASSALELLIDNTLQAQGHATIRGADSNRLPEAYDPAFIRADADLAQVADGIRQSRSGRLCLYGPPGTGKTAYARWLAQQLGMPLMVRRASDLMSKWVGENEKNIARAFRQAAQEDAVLLIDEVDSFLQDRRGAQRSWEVTQVNEMLTQLESFPGVFVASTNLMDGLDQAALRRFDLKVKFDYLGAAQAGGLLSRYAGTLGLPQPGEQDLLRLARLWRLTPGDFAAVVRQHRFRPLVCVDAFISALEGECKVKEDVKGAMGFV
jgi:transitional endoplasmic reticulum ATPase